MLDHVAGLQGVLEPVPATPDRGDARGQRGVAHRCVVEGLLRIVETGTILAIAEMRMAVHQPRKEGLALQVDDRGAVGHRHISSRGRDPLSVHQHRRPGHGRRTGSVDEMRIGES